MCLEKAFDSNNKTYDNQCTRRASTYIIKSYGFLFPDNFFFAYI